MRRFLLLLTGLLLSISILQAQNPGDLDLTFNADAGTNNTVSTTAIQPDGKILIGGDFTSYNGISITELPDSMRMVAWIPLLRPVQGQASQF